MSVSVVLEGLDGLGQVAVELHHAGWEERVDHGARQEAPQVRLEETEQLGFVWLPGGEGKKERKKVEFTLYCMNNIRQCFFSYIAIKTRGHVR